MKSKLRSNDNKPKHLLDLTFEELTRDKVFWDDECHHNCYPQVKETTNLTNIIHSVPVPKRKGNKI